MGGAKPHAGAFASVSAPAVIRVNFRGYSYKSISIRGSVTISLVSHHKESRLGCPSLSFELRRLNHARLRDFLLQLGGNPIKGETREYIDSPSTHQTWFRISVPPIQIPFKSQMTPLELAPDRPPCPSERILLPYPLSLPPAHPRPLFGSFKETLSVLLMRLWVFYKKAKVLNQKLPVLLSLATLVVIYRTLYLVFFFFFRIIFLFLVQFLAQFEI